MPRAIAARPCGPLLCASHRPPTAGTEAHMRPVVGFLLLLAYASAGERDAGHGRKSSGPNVARLIMSSNS